MVVTTSTHGTLPMMPANSPGAMLATAPISSPPALPPLANIRSVAVKPSATRCRPQSMKSVKVFFFWSSLPSSYHQRPISWPPRTWAMAKTKPRSSRLTTSGRKPASVEAP